MHLKIASVAMNRMGVVVLCAAWDVVCGILLVVAVVTVVAVVKVVAGVEVSSVVVVVISDVVAELLFVGVVVGFAVLVVARVVEDAKAPS